jgi:hypothetical protein
MHYSWRWLLAALTLAFPVGAGGYSPQDMPLSQCSSWDSHLGRRPRNSDPSGLYDLMSVKNKKKGKGTWMSSWFGKSCNGYLRSQGLSHVWRDFPSCVLFAFLRPTSHDSQFYDSRTVHLAVHTGGEDTLWPPSDAAHSWGGGGGTKPGENPGCLTSHQKDIILVGL